MRVFVNALSARLGGGQTYLLNLLSHFPRKQKCEALVVCPDTLSLREVPPNVARLRTIPYLDHPVSRLMWERFSLPTLLREWKADVLFCPGGLLPKAKIPASIKTAITFQNMLPFDVEQGAKYGISYRRLRDWMLERGFSTSMKEADLVVFISCFAENFVRQRLGNLKAKTIVAPHGVDPRFYQRSFLPSSLPNGLSALKYFLYVSFIDYYKSQIEVVMAYKKVRDITGRDCPLVLVGAEYAPYAKKLRRTIRDLRLENCVHMLGNVSHESLPNLYQNALINVFASCVENCPNILLEMMAGGRPALVSGRPPMPEFGDSTVTYFDPENVEELASKWVHLLRETEEADSLAATAKKRAELFSWQTAAISTWSAMETICRENTLTNDDFSMTAQ